MKTSTLLAFTLTGALALVSAPASAQHRRGGSGEEHQSNAAPRGERRDAAPQPQAQPRQPQAQQPRQEQAQPRQERQQPAQEQRAAPRNGNGQDGRAVPRQDNRAPRYAAPQYAAPRYAAPQYAVPRSSAPRYYSGRYYGPRYGGPRFPVAPRRFYRPYYVFRPRFNVGFGIWAGFPVTYYDPFYYPYDYYGDATPGYPPQGSVNVQPSGSVDQANMGGLSFDISPDTAEVYVDGNYVGEVGQFSPSSQPLGLPAGRHHVELREPGYQVTSFDVNIIAGQVIPYQGQLEP